MCGGPKTAKSCSNKWGYLFVIYRVICQIQAVSGWTWSDETGASITEDLVSSWDDFFLAHPKAKPFKHSG
ncbi:hypothetical protein BDQ17DRAFT_1237004 [Cyathus striatus]|nr:hypothetical protein BDQ17DRAFT_1237004 [Cyathus striatus]